MTHEANKAEIEAYGGEEFDRDVDEIKRSLDKDLELRLREIRENEDAMNLQRERFKMAEEVSFKRF